MTTVKHWMILFVGLMLEIYHCWLPLQERIPPICPWGWSDTSRVGLFLGLSILYPWRVSYLDRSIFGNGPLWTDCLFAEPWWSYDWRQIVHLRIFKRGPLLTDVSLLSHVDGLIKADRPLKDLWGWFGIEKPFVYWATLQAALLCDTRSAVYLYKLYFCHVCSQRY